MATKGCKNGKFVVGRVTPSGRLRENVIPFSNKKAASDYARYYNSGVSTKKDRVHVRACPRG